MNAPKYLVRFDGDKDLPRVLVWDARKPLPVGYPAKFVVENARSGVRLRRISGKPGVNMMGAVESVNVEGLAWSRFKQSGVNIEIRRLERDGRALTAEAARRLMAVPTVGVDPFHKLARNLMIGVMALALPILLWPSGESKNKIDEKLIPPQFAKILMKPQTQEKGKMTSSPSGGAAGEDSNAGTQTAQGPVKTAKDTAVVKAFRAKALQSAVRGLLSGGMTSLLAAQSNLISGDSRHEAKQLFERASVGAVATSPDAIAGNGRGVQVASLGGGGGGGVGGGVGQGVGYGSGRQAGVTGQGQGFVSMDIPGSHVDEGLTKDEVGKVIHSHISEIRYCYEASMIRSPDVEGKLVLDFTIGGNGAVKTAAVKESSLNDARLDDCILRRLTKWAFPKPNGGVDVAVAYPFVFKALKR